MKAYTPESGIKKNEILPINIQYPGGRYRQNTMDVQIKWHLIRVERFVDRSTTHASVNRYRNSPRWATQDERIQNPYAVNRHVSVPTRTQLYRTFRETYTANYVIHFGYIYRRICTGLMGMIFTHPARVGGNGLRHRYTAGPGRHVPIPKWLYSPTDGP